MKRKEKALPEEAAKTTEKSAVMQKAEDNLNVIFAALLLTVLLFTVSILSVTAKDREYSENENRYLAAAPVFSADSVMDGKFMKDTEAYLSDQFFARDLLVKARTDTDIFFGKKEVNDVYIGKQHFLFEKPAAYDEERVDKTVKAIKTLRKKNPKIRTYFALAPSASEILTDFMPANAPTQNQTEQIQSVYDRMKKIRCIDLCTPLKEAKEPTKLYYKTDHHWTANAAEIAFTQLKARMKIKSTKYTMQTYPVTNTFQGTLASSSGLFRAQDTISITVPEPEVKYTVTYVSENEKRPSVFDSSKLQQKSQYDVFFGGNFAQIRIDTSSSSKRVLLVIKDSYANCVVPMLIPYFKSIVMVDPRYYRDDIEATIEKEGVTDILWLYNINTFLNDTSIANMTM